MFESTWNESREQENTALAPQVVVESGNMLLTVRLEQENERIYVEAYEKSTFQVRTKGHFGGLFCSSVIEVTRLEELAVNNLIDYAMSHGLLLRSIRGRGNPRDLFGGDFGATSVERIVLGVPMTITDIIHTSWPESDQHPYRYAPAIAQGLETIQRRLGENGTRLRTPEDIQQSVDQVIMYLDLRPCEYIVRSISRV